MSVLISPVCARNANLATFQTPETIAARGTSYGTGVASRIVAMLHCGPRDKGAEIVVRYERSGWEHRLEYRIQLRQCEPIGNATVEPVWAFQWDSVATAIDNFYIAARQGRVNVHGGVTHQGAFPPSDHYECMTAKL